MDNCHRRPNHGRPNRGRPRRRICHDPARVRDPTQRIPRTLPRRLRSRSTDGERVSEGAEWPTAVFCEKADRNSPRHPFRSSAGHSIRKDETRGFPRPQDFLARRNIRGNQRHNVVVDLVLDFDDETRLDVLKTGGCFPVGNSSNITLPCSLGLVPCR
jgi:hypothetical protein